jgi:hypothetical protein
MVMGAILGLLIAGIIAIRKKHKLVLVVTAELMVGLMTGFIVGYAVSIGVWQALPKDYVLIENINLMRMNNQEPKCFVAEVKWRKNESSMYMFLRKDTNGKQKFDMIPIAKTAYPRKEQREDGLIRVFENKSKVYHLFTLASDFRYGIFVPEDSIILTSK